MMTPIGCILISGGERRATTIHVVDCTHEGGVTIAIYVPATDAAPGHCVAVELGAVAACELMDAMAGDTRKDHTP